jgi:predicted PurR-regulated permease PerM
VVQVPIRRSNPFTESVRVLGLYARAQALLILWEAVLFAIGFAFGKVPLWPLVAVVCALLSIIPRFGTLIGIGIALFLSWIADVDLLHLAITAGTWVCVQAIEGFWLSPKLMGRPLGLNPWIVFAVLLVGGFVLGPLGLILAVPILAVIMVWIRHFRHTN